MRVVAGADGWPTAYDYTAGGRTLRLSQQPAPIPRVLHMALFDPLDDHYGMAPLSAAQQSLDIHNAAAAWNKALLDNAARPSGALVYSAAAGNLTPDQFERLKANWSRVLPAPPMPAGRWCWKAGSTGRRSR
jgi:phage portal protein BeeE